MPHRRSRALDARLVVALIGLPVGLAVVAVYLALDGRDVAAVAIRNAAAVHQLERASGFDDGAQLLRGSLGTGVAGAFSAAFYAWGYWPFVFASVWWTARRDRRVMWLLVTAIAVSGLIGVVVMTVFPTAPPRFVGFTDVVARSPWSVLAHPDAVMNPFGAMPSFHVAWSLLAAAALVRTAQRVWLRALAVAQPVAMSIAVVATANHWFLDVVAGMVIATIAWAVLAPAVVRLVDRGRARDAGTLARSERVLSGRGVR